MKKYLLLVTLLLLPLLTNLVIAQPADLRGHWAEDYIIPLLEEDLMPPRSDGYFRPDLAITREDLDVLARIKGLAPEEDEPKISDLDRSNKDGYLRALVAEGIITTFPDGTFRSEEIVTRGELAQIMHRYLGLDDHQKGINPTELSSPRDLESDYYALDEVKIMVELDLMELNPDGSFRPDQGVTRAELAQKITALKELETVNSLIQEVYPASGRIALQSLDGSRRLISVSQDALLGRNNLTSDLDGLQKNDRVYLLLNSEGEAIYAKSYGLMSRQDIQTELSRLSRGILTQEDVASLMEGEISVLWPRLEEEVKYQLTRQGFASEEVDALFTGDWDTLENRGRTRLEEIISMETGLPLDITRALLQGDWELLQHLTTLELMQRALESTALLEIFSY